MAHESLFNVANGTYRGPSTQQGYSPFSTWTRGLAWAMLGFAEQIEFLETVLGRGARSRAAAAREVDAMLLDAARATCDHYIDVAAADGVPYWDAGAPGPGADGRLARSAGRSVQRSRAGGQFRRGDCRAGPAAPRPCAGGSRRRWRRRALHAGRTAASSTRSVREPYLSADASHQGLLLHSVYHWPNGWDYVPPGARTPRGESSQWGDYHLREAALYVKRLAEGAPYLTFFGHEAGQASDLRANGERTRSSPAARAGSASASRARWRRKAGTSRSAACARNRTRAPALDELRALGAAVHYLRGDLAQADDRRRIAAEARAALGPINALVNNAGRAPRVRADLLEATEDSFEEVLRTNLQGPYFLTQAIARDQVEQRRTDPSFSASIVFMTSVSAEMASPNRGEYCVSKAGLSMAARLFAARLAEHAHPRVRGPSRHHRDRHDRRRPRRLRPPHRRRPRARAALGPARRCRTRRGGAGARRRAVRDRHDHQRRRRAVDPAAVIRERKAR